MMPYGYGLESYEHFMAVRSLSDAFEKTVSQMKIHIRRGTDS